MSQSVLVAVALALGCLAYVVYPILGRGSARSGALPQPATPVAPKPLREVTDEEIEAAIRSYRATQTPAAVCPVCGPRPESDALYCSSCGRRLPG